MLPVSRLSMYHKNTHQSVASLFFCCKQVLNSWNPPTLQLLLAAALPQQSAVGMPRTHSPDLTGPSCATMSCWEKAGRKSTERWEVQIVRRGRTDGKWARKELKEPGGKAVTQRGTNHEGKSARGDWPGWWVQSGRGQALLCPVARLCWELRGCPSPALPDPHLPSHSGHVPAAFCAGEPIKTLVCIFQLRIFYLQGLGAQLRAPKLPNVKREP